MRQDELSPETRHPDQFSATVWSMITHLSSQDTHHYGLSPAKTDSHSHDDRSPGHCHLQSSSQRMQTQFPDAAHQWGELHIRDNKGFLRQWPVHEGTRGNVWGKVWKVREYILKRELYRDFVNVADMGLVLTASCAQTAIVAKDVPLKRLYAGTIGTVSGRHDWKSWQPVRELMVLCFIAGDWSFRKCSR